MGLSLPHLVVLALVVLVLFGRGRISEMMGDFGKGIKSFKEGMADETTNHVPTPPAQMSAPAAEPVAPTVAAATPVEPARPGQV